MYYKKAHNSDCSEVERTDLFLGAARCLAALAEHIDDNATKASLIYLSASAVQKSRLTRRATISSAKKIPNSPKEIVYWRNGRVSTDNRKPISDEILDKVFSMHSILPN